MAGGINDRMIDFSFKSMRPIFLRPPHVWMASSIVPFERERDQWRATIRRLDGRKIRVAVSYVTTSADTLPSEAAIDLAKQGIDRHSRMPAGPPARQGRSR